MQFSVLVISAFAALTIAAPAAQISKRAVFGATTYDAISVSGGVAGNALAEVNAVLNKLPADLKTTEKSDLTFLNQVNQIANDAEVDAFNVAIGKASGEAAAALQVRLSLLPSPLASARLLECGVLLTIYPKQTAWKDKEQGPQAPSYRSQAPGPGRAGSRGRREAG